MVFAIHQCESAISIYVSPPSWTPLPLPSLPHPSRLSQGNSLGCPESYIKLALVIYFHMVMCMFQYYSLKSSYLTVSNWVQESVLYVCVSFAALHVELSVPSFQIPSGPFSSVPQSCPTLCHPMNHSMPGLPVHHQLPEFTQTHVHWVGDAIQPSHPLSSPSPPAPNLSQHQSLFQWVNSSHEVAKVLEFQLQHQSFQWTPRTDLL